MYMYNNVNNNYYVFIFYYFSDGDYKFGTCSLSISAAELEVNNTFVSGTGWGI